MKRYLIKYSLEIFSAVVLVLTLCNLLFFPDISFARKLLNAFAILAVLHEFEEKRTPGGFYELMVKKFGIPQERCDFDLAGFFVITYWTVILGLSYIFENIVIFLLMPVALGFFETFVHTMGIWLHHMKKPYTPGLLSAWGMFFVSVYAIYSLNSNGLASGRDYLIGTALMLIGFAFMDLGTLHAFNTTISDIKNNLWSLRSN